MILQCPQCKSKLKKSIAALYKDMAIITTSCESCDLCWEFTFHGQPVWQKYNGNQKVDDGYGAPPELS